ncbi:hypothetical protein F183_A19580 [Bryobacterales bacterium F-183]|nr:hypothetical protein F183_A19580 [Bryobacterales bacterium F-183]
MKHLLAWIPFALIAAEPMIVDLKPRGAERGKPFVLTVTGRNLGEGSKVLSTLPGSFTPMAGAAMREVSFLVEPKADAAPGTYALRLQGKDGISNVLLFTLGIFPETSEEESEPGRPTNSNDTVESAQPLQSAPLVVNGKLNGPERDVYRVSGKLGERRVFEVEARRCGSALDPVIRILDAAGNLLARSEDAPGIGLDARIDFTFPKEGNYYVEVHDARYSTQEQNFYRLKMGSYAYAEDLFPLGGKRGSKVDVSLTGPRLAKPVTIAADTSAGSNAQLQWVNVPDSAALPLPFALSDYPELIEPAVAVAIPSVVNGRLSKAGEVDSYKLAVKPGAALMLEMQARELGTSKIIGLITVKDPATGKELARAGDEPVVEGLFGAQSLTARDPFLRFRVPDGVQQVAVTVEDLARRGGPGYGYRLIAREQTEDFTAAIGNPYVNIPRGGTARIIVTVDRRGVDGPIQFTIPNLPQGLTMAGGLIPAEGDRSSGGSKVFSRRGVITLTADANLRFDGELEVWAEGKTSDGHPLKRRALGPGTQIAVNGAVNQGAVDRQRTIQNPWLGMQLPAAASSEPAATLTVEQLSKIREAEGDRYQFRWKWNVRPGATVIRPDAITADIAGINDIRIIDVKQDDKDPLAGSFVITTTKVTMPSLYDLVASGRVMYQGTAEDIYAKTIRLEVTEFKANENPTAGGN